MHVVSENSRRPKKVAVGRATWVDIDISLTNQEASESHKEAVRLRNSAHLGLFKS